MKISHIRMEANMAISAGLASLSPGEKLLWYVQMETSSGRDLSSAALSMYAHVSDI